MTAKRRSFNLKKISVRFAFLQKPVKIQTGYNAAELFAAVQELEEITGKVREIASQLIRTEELQADLLGNRNQQVEEKDAHPHHQYGQLNRSSREPEYQKFAPLPHLRVSRHQ